jgi:CheY-like chemotaxis protein
LRPDLVFMDLAMPGMDGWETLRRIQALQLQPAPVLAVVSANAFDKGLDNLVDLPASDFFVKPVRRQDLLHWVGQKLHLQWQTSTTAATPAGAQRLPADAGHVASGGAGGKLPVLPAQELQALRELAGMGYYRGFVKRLDMLQTEHPLQSEALQRLRVLAREFRFETLDRLLQEALDAIEHHG